MNSNRRDLLKYLAAGAAVLPAYGQFGLSKSKNKDSKGSDAPGVKLPMAPAAFVQYLRIATDLGMEGTEKLLDLYPPDKIEEIKQICMKYAEAKKDAKPTEIDENQLKLASLAGEAAAKLEADKALVGAEKQAALRAANKKLGLMLLADGGAAVAIPAYVDSLKADIQSVSSNPLKAGSVNEMKRQLATLTFAGTAVPSQLKSFGTVRGVAKKIAEAQKVTLPPDPKPAEIASVDQLQKAGSATDV